MVDANQNGIPDEVEIAESAARRAAAESDRARFELEKIKLALQQPLYDRIVMRLVIPFCLAFAAPAASYYFSSKVEANGETIDKLEQAVERLERLVVESELRSRLPDRDPTSLANEYLQQSTGPNPADLEQFIQRKQ